jgi:hypothetical protein
MGKNLTLFRLLEIPMEQIPPHCPFQFSIVYVALPPPDLRFPLPLLTKDTTANVFIPGEDPASFLGKFLVDLYYDRNQTEKNGRGCHEK